MQKLRSQKLEKKKIVNSAGRSEKELVGIYESPLIDTRCLLRSPGVNCKKTVEQIGFWAINHLV